MNIRRALESEHRDALRLCHAAPDRSTAECRLLGDALAGYVSALSLELPPPWLVEQEGRTLAAAAAIVSPGRLGLLVMPGDLAERIGAETASRLLNVIYADLRERGVRLIQYLVEPAAAPLLERLLEGERFQFLARLNYMERSLRTAVAPLPERPGLSWTTYDAERAALFEQVVAESYDGSMDCPALSRLRPVSDALASHRAAGNFRPERWLLLRVNAQPAGCLLLNDVPLRASLEIVYMGLRPSARRRGLGQCLIHQALSIARRDGFGTLSLAVDAVNAPARRLYEAAAFQIVLQRAAWLRVLDERAKDSDARAAR